jgi:hypothetical protein
LFVCENSRVEIVHGKKLGFVVIMTPDI